MPRLLMPPALALASSAPAASSHGDDLFLGMTLAALALALFFSTLGLAYVVYAKKQSRLIIGLSGALLIIYPFFFASALPIALIGVLLAALPFLLKRVGIDV